MHGLHKRQELDYGDALSYGYRILRFIDTVDPIEEEDMRK